MGEAFARVALDGSLLLGILVAAVAGLVSFLSPCVLPLVPGYLGYVTGLGSDHERARRGRLLLGVGLFVLGFTAVFVLLGLAAGALGAALRAWSGPLVQVMGVVVIGMGLVFLGWAPGLQRERRLSVRPAAGLVGAPVLGVVFGLGWTPCIGPTLSAIIALSADSASALRGAVLSGAYGAGLGLPFLVAALAYGRVAEASAVVRRHRVAVTRVGGGLLVAVGVLLATGVWTSWMAALQGTIGSFRTVV